MQQHDRGIHLSYLHNRFKKTTELTKKVVGIHGHQVCLRVVKNQLQEFKAKKYLFWSHSATYTQTTLTVIVMAAYTCTKWVSIPNWKCVLLTNESYFML